mgnify:CR=1 FL=1
MYHGTTSLAHLFPVSFRSRPPGTPPRQPAVIQTQIVLAVVGYPDVPIIPPVRPGQALSEQTAAVTAATALGISDLVVGLTIVAAGTSLPEVATSILASIILTLLLSLLRR